MASSLARNRLGIPAVLFFVLSAAAPLTVTAGGVTAGYAITGRTGMPVAYLAVAAMIALFAVGYVSMSRHVVNAGAFYTYITRGLGRPAGAGGAFVALLAYNAMQVGLYGGFGVVLSQFLASHAGWDVHWLASALIGWVLVAALGVLRVDLNGRVLAFLLITECAVAAVFSAVMVGHPAGGELTFSTLAPSHLWESGAGAALVTAITGFVGIEATVVFSEETKDPRRTVARATYLAVGIIGLLYAGAAWAMSVATGPDRIVARATEDGTQLLFNLVGPYVGQTVVTLGELLFITSLFAALLSFHNAVARYGFALGRERVLPAALGRTGRQTGAPIVGSLSQTALALVVLIAYAVAGADPYVHLFFWVTVTGGLGVLILMVLTSVAVVAYFASRSRGESRFQVAVAPAVAAILLGAVLVLTVSQFDVLLGVDPSSPWRWVFPATYLAAAVIGVAWALVLRQRRPDVYRGIGYGVDAGTEAARQQPAVAGSRA
ncbi:APC family permease [Micromonospora maritima]|uniref:APC family permease n=1 Tax=Micromonospora maritima TaxID=986711 RepID=UPI001FE958DF|nr:APC family permease [Micromonospora maritima]